MKKINWVCGHRGYTAVYLTPYLRVGKHFAFVGFLRYEIGFWKG